MAISKARDIATSIGKAVKADTITSAGLVPSSAAAFSVYDSTTDLPTSGIAVGSQGYVSSNQRLYVRGDGGWYNIATVNNTPTITSVQTAGGDSSPFALASDGTTTTVITITATDSEGFPITFSATTDVGFDSIATVTNDSSVFTITPLSEDSAGTATSGTLTFKASDGVNIASEVATFTIAFKVENSNFTSVLVKASGNNGTNTTINDASSNPGHTITVTGDTVAQAFTPYHRGGYSVYFDGTGDYLSVPDDDASFDFGAPADGNFTIEGWLYPTALGDYDTVLTQEGTWAIEILNSKLTLWLSTGTSGSWNILNNQPISKELQTNEWVHFALVRNSNTLTSYINGISEYSATVTGHIGNSSNVLKIGYYSSNDHYWNGYMRDIRIVKGAAVYTANFTPPTAALTAIDNTKLLACSLPYIADGSSVGHSITINGNTHTERFGPYDYLAYSASSHGASVYFDGTGDYLSVAYSADHTFGSGQFTAEMWVYMTAYESTGFNTFLNKSDGTNNDWQFDYKDTSTQLRFIPYVSGSANTTVGVATATLALNTWHHVAASRDGSNNLRLFHNGVLLKTASFSSTIDADGDATLEVGARQNSGTRDRLFTGFMSDIRIIKGAAQYTSAFTPPTSPLTAITNTKLLTCNDAPNVFDAAGSANVVVLGADAKSSTAQTKNASASMYFDGTGDKVTFADLGVGAGDFLVEGWFRQTVAQSTDYRCWFGASPYSSSAPFAIFSYGSTIRAYIQGTSWIEYSSFSINTWYHLALKRQHGVWEFFVNGTSVGTSTLHSTYDFGSTVDWSIGGHPSSSSYEFTGYIEDFRITKDLCRYPFVPAKETLTAISGTDLLVAHAATLVDGNTSSGRTLTAGGNAAVSSFAPASGMYSIAFDGTNDNISVPTSSLGGTGDFTLEYWIYATSYSGTIGVIGDFNANGSGGWQAWWNPTAGEWRLGNNSSYGSGLNDYMGWSFTNTANKWYHHAWVRNSGTVDFFIDGSKITRTTNVGTMGTENLVDQTSTIGTFNDNSADLNGYISNLRIIEGTARYTNSFTPPTSKLTA